MQSDMIKFPNTCMESAGLRRSNVPVQSKHMIKQHGLFYTHEGVKTMKNRFIRKLTLICTAVLLMCFVSAWAAAEMTPATTTDLGPNVNRAENAEGVEVIITKALHIGDRWNGVMKKTKPAVLKLDVDSEQQVYILVQGRYVWGSVEKTDGLPVSNARILTNDDADQAVITWHAKAGSYLITFGPVEPSVMTKADVTVMNDADYKKWKAEQEEPDKIAEENMEEPALNPIVKPEMTDKPAEDIAPGFPGYEAEYSVHPEGPFDGPSEVDLPEFNKNVERDITVKVTWDVPDPAVGDTAHFKAVLTGYDDLEYTMQWQYSSDRETWYDIPDETTEKMDVAVTEENNVVYWRVLVFIEESRIK